MAVDLFREVRERISAEDAARHFGLEIDRNHKARCPFHNDRHPSLSFKNGRFRCWVCDISGDSIDFTGRYLGLDNMGALRRLNEDFSLALPLDRKPTREEIRHRQEVASAHAAFEMWRKATIRDLCRCVYMGNLVEKNLGLSELSELCLETLRRREWFEHLADTLANGTPEEQTAIWKSRGEVVKWTDKVLRE